MKVGSWEQSIGRLRIVSFADSRILKVSRIKSPFVKGQEPVPPIAIGAFGRDFERLEGVVQQTKKL